jgi:hypothetical protein
MEIHSTSGATLATVLDRVGQGTRRPLSRAPAPRPKRLGRREEHADHAARHRTNTSKILQSAVEDHLRVLRADALVGDETLVRLASKQVDPDNSFTIPRRGSPLRRRRGVRILRPPDKPTNQAENRVVFRVAFRGCPDWSD